MTTVWGAKKKGCQIGLYWASVDVASGGATAVLNDASIYFNSDQNVTDSSNSLKVSGSAVTDKTYTNTSFSGSGSRQLVNCTETTITLTYGQTTNVTFSASMTGVNYAEGTLSASTTITFPARAYIIPTAPAGFKVTRNSDIKHTLTWTNNVSTASPYQTMKLERWDSSSNAWTVLSTTLTSSTAIYVDSTTIADRVYQYRLTVGNTTGSVTVTSAQIATTPAAPVNLTLTKSGTTMSLIWTNKSVIPSANSTIQLWYSKGGAAYTLQATLASTATGYLHNGIDTAVTHQYQLRVVATPGPLYSAYLTSPVIQFLTAPSAPSLSGAAAWDFTSVYSLSWVHNSVDGTIQTAAEVQRRPVGADDLSWVTQTFTTQSAWAMPANTLTNSVTYEFRARTKGDHPNFGAWSTPSLLVTGSKRPTTTITAPTNGATWGAGNFTVAFTYADVDLTTISAWRVTLTRTYDSAVVYDYTKTLTTTDTAFVYTVPYLLENDASYIIRTYVRDGAGMWSDPASVTVPVSFNLPPEAHVDATFNDCSGQIEVVITNYPPGPTEVDATLQHVDRWDPHRELWVPVKSNVPVTNSQPLGDPVYNYATNPGFESYGGAVEIQRNQIKNPRMKTTATWAQLGASTVMTANADTTMTVKTGGAFANEGIATSGTGTAAATVVQASGIHYEVQVRGAVGALLTLQAIYYAVGGGVLTTVRQNFTGDGTWQRLVMEANPAPVGAAFVQVGVVTQATLATTFYLQKPLLEKLPSPGLYFDGYATTMGDVTASWTGVENASESILTIRVPTGSGLPTTDYYVMSSTATSESGARSARVYRRVVTGGAADPVWAQVATSLPNTAGQRYTLLFTARTAAVGGTVPGSFRVVDASTVQLLAFGTGTITDEEQARVEYIGNGNGVVRLQATIPKLSGGQSVWVDELGVFLGSYSGEWFSGALKPVGNVRYAWTGAKEASTSQAVEYGLDTLILVDQLPNLSQESRYRVTTQSATPTYNVGDPVIVNTSGVCYSYLNGGEDFELIAKFAGSPSLTQEFGRTKSLYTFAGRRKPLEYVGDARNRVYTVAGLAMAVQQAHFCDTGCDGRGMVDMVEAWEKMADLPAPLCYRDMRGVHRYCSISDVSVDYETSTPFANVSFTLTEIDYTPVG